MLWHMQLTIKSKQSNELAWSTAAATYRPTPGDWIIILLSLQFTCSQQHTMANSKKKRLQYSSLCAFAIKDDWADTLYSVHPHVKISGCATGSSHIPRPQFSQSSPLLSTRPVAFPWRKDLSITSSFSDPLYCSCDGHLSSLSSTLRSTSLCLSLHHHVLSTGIT